MPYTYVSMAQAETDLANRLFDPTFQFWPAAEIDLYLTEALRTWNALTSFWRAEFVFPLVENQWWYDIPNLPNTLRPYTVTDKDLVDEITAHLLEPTLATYPLTWTGSAQFSVTDILGAIQRRRDETLAATDCAISRSLIAYNFVTRRTNLPDNVIDIRRVAWFPDPAFLIPLTTLKKSDDWAEQAFHRSDSTQIGPNTYRQSAQPPLAFDVDILPSVSGQYEVLTVNAGNPLSSNNSTLLGIPDDWTWIIKWGALADLLGRESNAKDPLRAQYCRQRFEEGLGLLMNASAVLAARINDQPVLVDGVRNGDDFQPRWQALAASTPKTVYTAGLNLIAFAPKPDAMPYSATLSVVQNMPIGANIQVDRGDYDAILDYAQHLALFKAGGQEFAETVIMYQRFLKRASLYNSKLSELGQFQKPMYELSQLEQERNPVYGQVQPESANG